MTIMSVITSNPEFGSLTILSPSSSMVHGTSQGTSVSQVSRWLSAMGFDTSIMGSADTRREHRRVRVMESP